MTANGTPSLILYIYDDTEDILQKYTNTTEVFNLKKNLELLHLLLKKNNNLRFLYRSEQLDSIIKKSNHTPFTYALGIGDSGKTIAEELHKRSGWFPNIITINLKREEVEPGRYEFTDKSAFQVLEKLRIKNINSLALIDDTLYSGITFKAILEKLDINKINKIQAFCLQAIYESKIRLEKLIPVVSGFDMKGKVEKEVSIIRFSGLFEKGSIWRGSRKPLAFFDRPEWMKQWFPENYQEIIKSCITLSEIIEK